MAADNAYFKFKLEDGREYELQRSEITVSALRQFKQWFGAAYGKFLTFTQLLLEGDADAWCCALWLVQKNNGEKPKDPRFMDFPVGDVMLSAAEDDGEDEESAEDEADPTEDGHQAEPTMSAEPTHD